MSKKFAPLFVFVSLYSFFAMRQVSVPYTNPTFVIEYAPYLGISALGVFLYWWISMRSSTPLKMPPLETKSFRLFWFLVFFCGMSSLVTLVTAESVNYAHLLILMGVGIAVGINEEFVFRVAGYRNFIAQGTPQKKAVFMSAFLFSSFHLLNIGVGVPLYASIFQLVNAFMMGCVLAHIYYLTRSVLYPIIVHGMWDFSSFSNSLFGVDSIKGLVAACSMIVSLFAFIWFLVWLYKQKLPIKYTLSL